MHIPLRSGRRVCVCRKSPCLPTRMIWDITTRFRVQCLSSIKWQKCEETSVQKQWRRSFLCIKVLKIKIFRYIFTDFFLQGSLELLWGRLWREDKYSSKVLYILSEYIVWRGSVSNIFVYPVWGWEYGVRRNKCYSALIVKNNILLNDPITFLLCDNFEFWLNEIWLTLKISKTHDRNNHRFCLCVTYGWNNCEKLHIFFTGHPMEAPQGPLGITGPQVNNQ